MTTATDSDRQSDMLTIDQASTYLAISKATLYTWRTRRPGFGPRAIKLGGCLRYRRSDLDAWVADHVETADELATIADERASDGISLSRASGPRRVG